MLEIKELSVDISTRAGTVKAVRTVSFTVGDGKTLALVGESGSGKTVTARAIMGFTRFPPLQISGGEIVLSEGLQRRELSMIVQDPVSALNPTMPVGVQIAEVLTHHFRLNRRESRAQAVHLLSTVGISDPVLRYRHYPHQLSGGMCQRVMIAIALASKPRLLIADEPTSSLDVTVQAQVLRLIATLQQRYQMSMIIITHDLSIVAASADHVVVMYAGKAVENGPTREIFHRPYHPYTRGLLAALPDPDAPPGRLTTIPGDPPDMINTPSGCAFRPRCREAMRICRELEPPAALIGPAHRASCWLAHRPPAGEP